MGLVGGVCGPGLVALGLIATAARIGTAFYAFGLVLLRARALRDPIVYIVAFQNVGPALLLAPFAYAVWREPSLADLGALHAVRRRDDRQGAGQRLQHLDLDTAAHSEHRQQRRAAGH